MKIFSCEPSSGKITGRERVCKGEKENALVVFGPKMGSLYPSLFFPLLFFLLFFLFLLQLLFSLPSPSPLSNTCPNIATLFSKMSKNILKWVLREEGRWIERENIYQDERSSICCLLHPLPVGDRVRNQACALTRNRTRKLLFHGSALHH